MHRGNGRCGNANGELKLQLVKLQLVKLEQQHVLELLRSDLIVKQQLVGLELELVVLVRLRQQLRVEQRGQLGIGR